MGIVRERKTQILETFRAETTDVPACMQGPTAKTWSGLQVLGQAHLTYVICQGEEGLVLIDQHAAHERVQFEKLMHSWRVGSGGIDVQEFLFPIEIPLNQEQSEALLAKQNDFAKLGLTIVPSAGVGINVQSSPSVLKENSLVRALEKASWDVLEMGESGKMEDVIAEFCALAACHSAIRAGQAMSRDEAQALLEAMDEFPMSSFCPHGRPVSVQFSISFLEKEFGRRA